MKEYEKPMVCVIDVANHNFIAASNLTYTNESADKDYDILICKPRGEWGNLWK